MCSELYGVNHQSMPIEIHVVSDNEFSAWMKNLKKNMLITTEALELLDLNNKGVYLMVSTVIEHEHDHHIKGWKRWVLSTNHRISDQCI